MRILMLFLVFLIQDMVLSAPAAAQVVHNNKLTWVQGACSAPCAVTGNNVYRSRTTGGPYTKIQTSTVPIITYTDTSVVGNDVWFYVATATCATCSPQESAFSNEVKATTPGDVPSGAPASLSVVSQ